MVKNIFDFVSTEEASYKTTGVTVQDGFEWHMPEHIRQCILVKDGRLLTGNSDDKPIENIVLPILNVQYRTEGFDVKNIELYVNSDKDSYKSLLVRKYHEKWARDNNVDTLIDDVVESYVDFGGVLVKDSGKVPEVIPLQKLAFCDQTDILSGPFAIKHQYSIDQLKDKSDRWNKEAIDEVVIAARSEKTNNNMNSGKSSKTPGKYIEVYEVHGMFPKSWLTDNTEYYHELDEDEYCNQIHIISFNSDKENFRNGTTLFRGKEKKGLFKVLKRDKRYGTALGRSAIEELFEAQVWTNYNHIQLKSILDKTAMILGVTDDPTFATKNKITEMEQGEWLVKQPNTSVEPFIYPAVNTQQFQEGNIAWKQHARTTGSAEEAVLGISPSAGTPFKLQELVTQEGTGTHVHRQGKISTFFVEMYRDWALADVVEDINKGKDFMSELTLDELQEVTELVVSNHVEKAIRKKMLKGMAVNPEEKQSLINISKEVFLKKGTKRFLKILKDEIADIPVDVFVNIAGKQKNLPALVDKLSNVVRLISTNPQILQDPNVAKLVNASLEASGLSPIQFKFTPPTQVNQESVKSPIQELPAKV